MAMTPTQEELYSLPPMIGAAPPRTNGTATDRRSRLLKAEVVAKEQGMGRLLRAMRDASGLTTRQIAKRMGIEKESLAQRYWERTGKGGTSRLDWFLRYAEATGCRIYVTYPSMKEQYQLRLVVEKETKPDGQAAKT